MATKQACWTDYFKRQLRCC